ncbi:MAG: type II toxin-antitoxin system VapC family toxin [Pseudomonadota bacterium]
MRNFVLDASVTMAWCFEDEDSSEAWSVLDRLQEDRAIVPSLWPLEVNNVLVQAERRQRITVNGTTEFLSFLSTYVIEIDRETESRTWTETLQLARQKQLSLYDASYLELALRHTLPLATLDRELVSAARSLGVATLPQ